MNQPSFEPPPESNNAEAEGFTPGQLRQSLAEPPDRSARSSWAPRLCYGRHFGPAPLNTRPAAVLLLLTRQCGQWRLPLTLRPSRMLHHGGQICLPGGTYEGDESGEQCAWREFQEELGPQKARVHFLGRLSPLYIFNSQFLVTPCVAWTDDPLHLQPNPEEVERIYLPLLHELLSPNLRGELEVQRSGLQFRAPCMMLDGGRVWGATSMILGELRAHLERLHAASAVEVDSKR